MKIIDMKKKIGEFDLSIPDFEIEEGKIHGFIGSNGCGKTTLAKLIMGILTPDSGVVDLGEISRKEVTMTSQRPYLLHSSVYENLLYPLKIRGRKSETEKIDYLLEKCGLIEKKKQYARSLSSGEQQKLSFIRALVFDPKLIIVDETLSNLDPDSVELFLSIIREVQEKKPITWVFISHQMVQVRQLCDQLHFLAKGEVVASGTPDELIFQSRDERLRQYISKQLVETLECR